MGSVVWVFWMVLHRSVLDTLAWDLANLTGNQRQHSIILRRLPSPCKSFLGSRVLLPIGRHTTLWRLRGAVPKRAWNGLATVIDVVAMNSHEELSLVCNSLRLPHTHYSICHIISHWFAAAVSRVPLTS
jgi:hypothetical protein